MRWTLGLWSATLGCLLAGLPAQAQHWAFQPYGPDLGLTNLTILCLHQDREGYLWVSTEGGIFRYDGDRFRPFAAKSGTRTGHTYSMHTSPDGQFWTSASAATRLLSPKSASSVFVASDGTVGFGCGQALCSLRDGSEHEWAADRGV